MYDEIMSAARAIAQNMQTLHDRTAWLESELDKEKQRKEQLKQDLYAALASYFQED